MRQTSGQRQGPSGTCPRCPTGCRPSAPCRSRARVGDCERPGRCKRGRRRRAPGRPRRWRSGGCGKLLKHNDLFPVGRPLDVATDGRCQSETCYRPKPPQNKDLTRILHPAPAFGKLWPCLPILEYPDPRLRKVAAPVHGLHARRSQKLVRDMAETMYAAPGVGLAATQVDVHKRVIVIDISETKDDLLVLINPEILAAEGEAECEEGCLSVPGYYDKVTRAARITVRAQNERGEPIELDRGGPARRVHPARNGPSGRQGVRRLPVAAEARAARRQAAQEAAAGRLTPAHASRRRVSRAPRTDTALRVGFAGTPALRRARARRASPARGLSRYRWC